MGLCRAFGGPALTSGARGPLPSPGQGPRAGLPPPPPSLQAPRGRAGAAAAGTGRSSGAGPRCEALRGDMAVRGQGHGDTATPATPGRDPVPKEPLPGGDGGVWLWESLISG